MPDPGGPCGLLLLLCHGSRGPQGRRVDPPTRGSGAGLAAGHACGSCRRGRGMHQSPSSPSFPSTKGLWGSAPRTRENPPPSTDLPPQAPPPRRLPASPVTRQPPATRAIRRPGTSFVVRPHRTVTTLARATRPHCAPGTRAFAGTDRCQGDAAQHDVPIASRGRTGPFRSTRRPGPANLPLAGRRTPR